MTGQPAFLSGPAETPVVAAVSAAADAVEWNRYVAGHPRATGYHDWAWREVLSGALGHESIYLVARRGSRIAGVLPLVYIRSLVFGRSMTSLPFLNYGGVLADDASAAASLVAAAADAAERRKCGHVERRHLERQFTDLPVKQHKVTMKLPLESGMWERLDRKVRNQIRKAQKSALVSEAGGPERLGDFYQVFARNMRDLGTPVYGRRFFDAVLRTFGDRTRVHVVKREGTAIAAGITFRTGTGVEVPWASSIRDFNALCPNHLLYWGILEQAVADGCTVLDFGRSTPNEGTFKFKEQWGARPVALHWEYRLLGGAAMPNTSPTNARYRAAIAAWKKLPLALATSLGPALSHGIP
jgi:FemAB-related protein (PEP-CTERM system-associated)